jgi:hypothetical protein
VIQIGRNPAIDQFYWLLMILCFNTRGGENGKEFSFFRKSFPLWFENLEDAFGENGEF